MDGEPVRARPAIPLEPVDSLTVTTLIENYYDLFAPDQDAVGRAGLASLGGGLPAVTMMSEIVPDQLVAEHGFSVLVETTRAGRGRRLLFDLGVSPDGMVENMRRLAVDPKDVEAIVCSHGHYDHTAGLAGLYRTLGRTGLPVLIHPEFFNRRRVMVPGRDPFEIPTTSRSALRGAGFEIVEEAGPSFLLDGSVLVTGEVPRTSGYEPGLPIQQAWRDDHWEPDPLVLDDQALVIDVRGEGLVVITGCGHAGIVNICRHVLALTGQSSLSTVIGGLHLNGPLYEPLIGRVCEDLRSMRPRHVIPGHCTGWRAQSYMAGFFGAAFAPNMVGTRIHLGSPGPPPG